MLVFLFVWIFRVSLSLRKLKVSCRPLVKRVRHEFGVSRNVPDNREPEARSHSRHHRSQSKACLA